MMGALRLSEVRSFTGGEIHGADVAFDKVSTDTRTLEAGALFVALRGPHFDGNGFVALAAEKQAVAALVSAPVAAPLPLLQVADTRLALGLLGRENRLRSKAKVIALTGSQGKTTVKEMTAAILREQGAVLSTEGNLNNDYGVPLTLLRIAPPHRFAVVEMGANAGGEIDYTTQLVLPDIAHITCVAPTHVEGFGSLQGVAEAKAELWRGLRPGATAVLNLDDPLVLRQFVAPAGVNVVTVSAAGSETADYRLTGYRDLGLAGSAFTLVAPQGAVSIALPLPGRHNAANALAAAAMALLAGASLASVAAALGRMQSVKGRLVTLTGTGGAAILDDSYNASPASFKAAIDVLASLPGLRIVAAGDMAELGDYAVEGHREVGAYARSKGIERFFAIGPLMQHAREAFGASADDAETPAVLAGRLRPLLTPHTSVLVKGSRSAGMERLVRLLTTHDGAAEG
jgi:UDP-N-acetylmuramoyl-tripeptide--D-alanyl-D-alanine ligase